MSEAMDPAIKLFGAHIRFPDTISGDFDHLHHPPYLQHTPDRCVESKVDDSPNRIHGDEGIRVIPTSLESVNRVGDVEVQCVEADTGSQERVLKRPDKVIPCPRCKSLNTKFCYFNNYNVNQPRHFCKNCQRYWTAGGTIRNVPVGAGKRKNKQLPLHYNQDTGYEGIFQGDSVSSSHPIQSNHSLSVPSAFSDRNDETAKLCMTPLCESMVSMFRQNDFELSSIRAAEEPSSSVSSASSTTLNELELPYNEASVRIRPSVFYYGSTPSISHPYCTKSERTYPWIPVAGLTQPGEPVQTGAVPIDDAPVICTSGMSYPVIPYWGCMPVFNVSALTVPLAGCSEQLSPLFSTDGSCSTSSSPNLGKHLRETNVTAEEKTEKCLWAPKSKKIESMDKVAKCPILDSVGVKPGKNEPISKGGVFKAFRSKPETKHAHEETVPSLELNPAALSRSQSFQEST